MSHANARLMPAGRLLMVRRVELGMPQANVAVQMGLCWGTAAKWLHRYLVEGETGSWTDPQSHTGHRCAPQRKLRSGFVGFGPA